MSNGAGEHPLHTRRGHLGEEVPSAGERPGDQACGQAVRAGRARLRTGPSVDCLRVGARSFTCCRRDDLSSCRHVQSHPADRALTRPEPGVVRHCAVLSRWRSSGAQPATAQPTFGRQSGRCSVEAAGANGCGDAFALSRTVDHRCGHVLDPQLDAFAGATRIGAQRTEVRRSGAAQVARLRHGDAGGVDASRMDQSTLDRPRDEPVAPHERPNHGDLGVHERGDEQNGNSRPPRLLQQVDDARQTRADRPRCLAQIGELRARHTVTSGPPQLIMISGCHERFGRRRVQPGESLPWRRREDAPDMLGLSRRLHGTTDDCEGRIERLGPGRRPDDQRADHRVFGPSTVDLGRGTRAPDPRLRSRLGSPAPQSLVPPQLRAGLTSFVQCRLDLRPGGDRGQGVRSIAHPASVGGRPPPSGPSPDSARCRQRPSRAA